MEGVFALRKQTELRQENEELRREVSELKNQRLQMKVFLENFATTSPAALMIWDSFVEIYNLDEEA
jgi:hypothetical protein